VKLLKLVGVLIDYPQDELWLHREEMLAAAEDPALTGPRRAELRHFIDGLLDADALAAQDAWLTTFDRGRSMSLLLFEHIHGESRDRGQAMVDLIDTYRRNGFELDAKELPDYLPLLLEYLSHCPAEEARDWLGYVKHIIGMLGARAAERQSPYASLFAILVDLADGDLELGALRQRASEEPRDDTAEVMDRVWEDEAVRFGSGAPTEDCVPTSRAPAGIKESRQVPP
jgi:nitrate reductase delta subunit